MSPIPARFVIDRQGIIRMPESDPDYTTRPEPADTLEAVRALPRQH
jgi:peroxiredoxin